MSIDGGVLLVEQAVHLGHEGTRTDGDFLFFHLAVISSINEEIQFFVLFTQVG